MFGLEDDELEHEIVVVGHEICNCEPKFTLDSIGNHEGTHTRIQGFFGGGGNGGLLGTPLFLGWTMLEIFSQLSHF